jgi:hypothetical protein
MKKNPENNKFRTPLETITSGVQELRRIMKRLAAAIISTVFIFTACS